MATLEQVQQMFLQAQKDVNKYVKTGFVRENLKLNKCTHSLGRCRKFGYGLFEIEISEHLLKCDDELIRNVLLHEIIHTISGHFAHNHYFYNTMNYLNKVLNAKIEVRNTNKQFKENLDYKYKITCNKCGKSFYRMRLPKDFTGCTHAQCGGSLQVEVLR